MNQEKHYHKAILTRSVPLGNNGLEPIPWQNEYQNYHYLNLRSVILVHLSRINHCEEWFIRWDDDAIYRATYREEAAISNDEQAFHL